MLQHGFDINITVGSINVQRNPRPSPGARFGGAAVVFGAMLLGLCCLISLPGKHNNPSMWTEFSISPADSSDFLFPLFLILTYVTLMGWLAIRWTLAAWPVDEELRCERGTFTVSRARWLDVKGTLYSQSYALSDISQLRYGVIATAKGSTIYGLRFRAVGKNRQLLAGLQAPEAGTILTALKTFGADVADDSKLQKRIQKTLEVRGTDTSWMDRSWMDDSDGKQ